MEESSNKTKKSKKSKKSPSSSSSKKRRSTKAQGGDLVQNSINPTITLENTTDNMNDALSTASTEKNSNIIGTQADDAADDAADAADAAANDTANDDNGHAIKSVQIEIPQPNPALSHEKATPQSASSSTTTTSSSSRRILYDLILAKNFTQAEEFLSNTNISIKDKKVNLQYQDNTDNEFNQGHTPVVRAILKQSTPFSLIKLMIQYGGIQTLRIPNTSQWTILHWAAYSNHVSLDVFKLILQKCDLAMIKGVNNYGKTSLEILFEKVQSSSSSSSSSSSIHAQNQQDVMKSVMDKVHALITKEQRLVLHQQQLSKINAVAYHDHSQYSHGRTTTNTSGNSNSSIYQTIKWARQLPESQQNTVLFKHDGFKNLLNYIFISRPYLFVSMMDLYVQLGIVAIYSFFLRTALHSSSPSSAELIPSLIILTIGFIWFFLRKTTQLLSSQLKMFILEPCNVLDMIQFVLLIGSIFIVLMLMDNEDERGFSISVLDRIVFTAATCVSWLKLLFVVGNLYYSIAVFIIAVIAVSMIVASIQYYFCLISYTSI